LRKQLQQNEKLDNLGKGITELTQVLKPKQVDFKLPDTISISIICFFWIWCNYWHRLLFLVNISIILKYLCQKNKFFLGKLCRFNDQSIFIMLVLFVLTIAMMKRQQKQQ
jgi:hypothetical protein